MGAFDDLLPATSAGTFDDLIPDQQLQDQTFTGELGSGHYLKALQAGLGNVMKLPARAAYGIGTGGMYQPTDQQLETPLVSPEIARAIMKAPFLASGINQTESPVRGALGGVGNVASGATTPENIALLGIAPEGKLAQRLIAGTFLGQSLLGTPEQWQAFKDATTASEKTRIGVEMGLGLALPAAGLAHSFTGARPESSGLRSSETVTKTDIPVQTTQETARAGVQSETATVLQTPAQTVENQGVEVPLREPVQTVSASPENLPQPEPTNPSQPSQETSLPNDAYVSSDIPGYKKLNADIIKWDNIAEQRGGIDKLSDTEYTGFKAAQDAATRAERQHEISKIGGLSNEALVDTLERQSNFSSAVDYTKALAQEVTRRDAWKLYAKRHPQSAEVIAEGFQQPGITQAIAEIQRRNAPSAQFSQSVEPQPRVVSPESQAEETGLRVDEQGATPQVSGRIEPQVQESVAGTQPENTPTGTKNASIDLERESRGIAPAVEAARHDFGTVWDEAEAAAKQDPTAPQRLVESIRDNPRALSDHENALLLRRQIEVQNEHSAAMEALNSAPDSPEAISRLESARNELQTVYDAVKSAGTETGRGLNARRMLANNDFTLAKMEAETRAVANSGRPLSPKQSAEVKTLWERVNKAESRLAEYEAKDEFSKSIQSARKSRVKPFSPVDFLEERAIKARERIIARRSKLYADPLGVTHVAHLADEAIIGAAHIARGVRNFKDWSAAMLKDFGDGIKPYLKALFAKSQGMHSEAARLAMSKAHTVGSTVKILSKIGSGDLEPTKLPPVRPDRELLDLRANLQRAKDVYAQRLEQQRLKNRSLGRRASDTFVKAERAMKLTGITTLGKLFAAGGTRLVSSAVEEAVGGLLSHSPILKRIASEAPREGGLNLKAEVLAPTRGVMRGIRNIPRVLKGERTTEEALYGKHHLRYETGSILDVPGRIHGAIKSPFKEAERTRSEIKREAFAQRKGEDLGDPATQLEIGKAANLDAQRAIFMQDNVLSDWFRTGVRSLETSKKFPNAGFAMAKVANFLLPIVKVPTNVAFETMTHIGGTLSGTGKLIHVMRNGLKNIKPEEADFIMRHYKKGLIGAGLFFTGYFNADKFGGFYQPGEKRDPKDVKWGGARFGGVNIPSWLLHAPAFIVLQAGATAYRMEHRVSHGEEKGKLAGIMQAAEGLAHEIPFVNEMSRLDKILAENWEGKKARGDLLRSSIVPQGVQNIAGWLDDKQRSPKNEIDSLKMGIPGLREQVPEKKKPGERRKTLDEAMRQRKTRQVADYLNR